MLFIESNDFAMFLFYINMYQRHDKYLLPLFEYIHIGSAVYEEELYLYVRCIHSGKLKLFRHNLSYMWWTSI